MSPAAHPGIFSVAGNTPPNEFLADMADGAADFDGLQDANDLNALLFYYVSTPLPIGGNSFQSGGALASNQNWRAGDLLDPALSDPNWCQPGETPLNCELRVNRPTVLFVFVGRNDVLLNTPPDQFQAALDQIVQVSIQQGAIPVLVTIPGDRESLPGAAGAQYRDRAHGGTVPCAADQPVAADRQSRTVRDRYELPDADQFRRRATSLATPS